MNERKTYQLRNPIKAEPVKAKAPGLDNTEWIRVESDEVEEGSMLLYPDHFNALFVEVSDV